MWHRLEGFISLRNCSMGQRRPTRVIQLHSNLSPRILLETILNIEQSLGRKRELKYGPRNIDIDILFFNDEIIDEEGLHIPHPRMQDRRFVLVPLAEIAAKKIHPVFFLKNS